MGTKWNYARKHNSPDNIDKLSLTGNLDEIVTRASDAPSAEFAQQFPASNELQSVRAMVRFFAFDDVGVTAMQMRGVFWES